MKNLMIGTVVLLLTVPYYFQRDQEDSEFNKRRAAEGEMCGGFQQTMCRSHLMCLFFDPSRVMDRQGVCVRL